MTLSLRYAAKSHVGLIRDGNEDSGYAGPRLLVVADGMGGHVAGEVASSVTVATLAGLDEDIPGHDLLDALGDGIARANQQLHEMVLGEPDLEGMGTTVTALLWAGTRLGLAHVGDSRCYLLRDGRLSRITTDHTFVQSLVDDGRISPEEADHHPQRSLLTRALDGRGEVEPDLSVREVRAGDRYLLCSDGLSGVVGEETLAETLARPAPPQDVCDALIELALRAGGPDNITSIVADVVDTDTRPSDVPETVGAAADRRARRNGTTAAGDTAASRAALLRPRPVEDDPDDVDPVDHRAGRRPRWGLRLLGLALVLAVLVGGAYGGYRWTRTQYYVGADGAKVAIYRGISQGIGDWKLSDVYRRQDIALSDLPVFERQQVRDSISARSLTDARAIVSRLAEKAKACITQRTTGTGTLDCGGDGS